MPNSTTQTPEVDQTHFVTRDTAGELRCDCKTFRQIAILFGEGGCPHTRRVELAEARREAGK